MEKEKKVKKKLKKIIIFKSFSFFFFIISFICFILCLQLKVLSFKFLLPIFLFLCFLNFIFYRLMVSRHWKKRMIGCLFIFLFSGLMGIGIFYESITLGFFSKAFQTHEKIENYQVLILDSSNYNSLKELKNGKIGVPNTTFSEGAKELQNEIKKRTTLTIQEMDNSSLVQAFMNKSLRVIVMEEAQKNIFCEMNEDFKNQIRILETIPIKVKDKVVKKDVAITKKPFHVYISGTDDYGTIHQVTRSDVNIILTVNPITHQILMTSIPRDYYVSLEGMKNAKDKLTHASLYGIDTSIKTLENLLDLDISYYVKINFSSLVNLVEAVGGIEVVSDQAFTAHYYDEPVKSWVNYTFVEGVNYLNGKQALAFSRERKSFLMGDRIRAINQQRVLSALIKKVAGPSILKNYTKILNALDGSFDTNFSYDDIMGFIQKQLDDSAEWNLEQVVLEGTDDHKPVYSISGVNSYVMIPDEKSIEEAKVQIQNVMEG